MMGPVVGEEAREEARVEARAEAREEPRPELGAEPRPESSPPSHALPSPPRLLEFRGPGDLLLELGVLPARGRNSGRTRSEVVEVAEALLRRLGPWRWGRGYRVPEEVLAEVVGDLAFTRDASLPRE